MRVGREELEGMDWEERAGVWFDGWVGNIDGKVESMGVKKVVDL